MANCIVIGGGFAGLSAAVNLISNNHSVRVIEASPKLGGRAYSFSYKPQNDIVDNGQHILMGCYDYTISFLKKIGGLNGLEFQDRLNVNFVDRSGELFKLSGDAFFYPFNLLYGMLNYTAISFADRINILKLFSSLLFKNKKKYSALDTKTFLIRNHQSDRTIEAFWEILHVGIMNCKLNESSAELFVTVLKEIFFGGNQSSTIITPRIGLSELYCSLSEEFIKARNGEIKLSTRVISLIKNDKGRITKIETDKGIIEDFDFVVLASSPYNAGEIFSASGLETGKLPKFKYSPILTCHIWLEENPFPEKFYGFIDSSIHWLFNHGKHISLVTSAAGELINKDNETIIQFFMSELEERFGFFNRGNMIEYLVIKEKRATFIPDNDVIKSRKLLNSYQKNLILAGDWTNTGLPSTIEGAVKSGYLAAGYVESYARNNRKRKL